jgi:hypothetical protein
LEFVFRSSSEAGGAYDSGVGVRDAIDELGERIGVVSR